MKKYWLLIIVLFLFNSFLDDALCMKVITDEDNGKEIVVNLSETFQLELKSMGSAGYKWFLRDFDKGYVELLSEETKPLNTVKVGSPIIYIWRFKAIKEGVTTLELDYYRPWEGLDKKEKEFNIRIVIREE